MSEVTNDEWETMINKLKAHEHETETKTVEWYYFFLSKKTILVHTSACHCEYMNSFSMKPPNITVQTPKMFHILGKCGR